MQLHDILLLRTSDILDALTSSCGPHHLYQLGDGLPPLIPVFFTTYRGGRHLPADIILVYHYIAGMSCLIFENP